MSLGRQSFQSLKERCKLQKETKNKGGESRMAKIRELLEVGKQVGICIHHTEDVACRDKIIIVWKILVTDIKKSFCLQTKLSFTTESCICLLSPWQHERAQNLNLTNKMSENLQKFLSSTTNHETRSYQALKTGGLRTWREHLIYKAYVCSSILLSSRTGTLTLVFTQSSL